MEGDAQLDLVAASYGFWFGRRACITAPANSLPIAAADFASYLCHEVRAEPFRPAATSATFAVGIRSVRFMDAAAFSTRT